jgi:uracil-DNA glycosylase
VLLYPLYHPAAALYTPSMLRALKDDFSRLPHLLGQTSLGPAPAHGRVDSEPEAVVDAATATDSVQLGLF